MPGRLAINNYAVRYSWTETTSTAAATALAAIDVDLLIMGSVFGVHAGTDQSFSTSNIAAIRAGTPGTGPKTVIGYMSVGAVVSGLDRVQRGDFGSALFGASTSDSKWVNYWGTAGQTHNPVVLAALKTWVKDLKDNGFDGAFLDVMNSYVGYAAVLDAIPGTTERDKYLKATTALLTILDELDKYIRSPTGLNDQNFKLVLGHNPGLIGHYRFPGTPPNGSVDEALVARVQAAVDGVLVESVDFNNRDNPTTDYVVDVLDGASTGFGDATRLALGYLPDPNSTFDNGEANTRNAQSYMSGAARAGFVPYTLAESAETGFLRVGMTFDQPSARPDVLRAMIAGSSRAGGSGDDWIVVAPGASADGGAGTDVAEIEFYGRTSGLTLNLGSNAETALEAAAGVVLTNFESYVVSGTAYADAITGSAAAETLYGHEGNDTLNGAGGADVLIGGFGDDILNGGAGADVMRGGDGNDWYYVDNAADVIVEQSFWPGAEQGTADRVLASVNYTLGAGVTVEIMSTDNNSGTSAIDLTGNELVNAIYGNAGANTLRGMNGNDTLNGLGGDDRLEGGNGDDILNGGDGADILDGGQGVDAMAGGLGNDWYYVDNADDVITEAAGQGTADRVLTAVSYSLRSGVDIEILTTTQHSGTAAINLTGNSVGNTIHGNAGVNSIHGGGGNDVLWGREGNDDLMGGTGTDTLYGGDGADSLRGQEDNDVLVGGAGSDQIYGGDGYDIAVYSGARGGYATATSSGVTGGVEGGTDTISGVESLAFLDGQLTFHRDGIAAQVMRLYDSAFNRIPDAGGFEAQLDAMEGGMSLNALAQLFVESVEFQNTYGALADRAFVEQLYRNVLDREGDSGGIANALSSLSTQGGTMTRGQLLVAFSESTEHMNLTQGTLDQGLWIADEQTLIIARLYDAAWNRLPDEGGLITWRNALGGGTSLQAIADAFAGAAEFTNTYGTLDTRQFVEQLYRNVLNREGDEGGIQNAVNAIELGGQSRGQVMLAFSESAEHIAVTRDLWIGGVSLYGSASAPVGAKEADEPQTLPGADEFVPLDAGNDDGALVLPGVDVVMVWAKEADEALVLPGLDDGAVFVTPGHPGFGHGFNTSLDDAFHGLRNEGWLH